MSEANYQIKGSNAGKSTALMADKNTVPLNWGDANFSRKPDYFVYIFTVSKRAFLIRQPTLFPRLSVPACSSDEHYKLVAKIPHPFQELDITDGGAGQIINRGHDARQVAMSLVNPNNLTLDQDAAVAPGSVTGIGNNLSVQGVFWTLNEVPTEEELVKAEKRREVYYRSLLNKARALEVSNPKGLEDELNQDYRMAADYFGEEFSWHKRHTARATCPNCGESITPGIAYHKNKELDMLCIIDRARAEAAGIRD